MNHLNVIRSITQLTHKRLDYLIRVLHKQTSSICAQDGNPEKHTHTVTRRHQLFYKCSVASRYSTYFFDSLQLGMIFFISQRFSCDKS